MDLSRISHKRQRDSEGDTIIGTFGSDGDGGVLPVVEEGVTKEIIKDTRELVRIGTQWEMLWRVERGCEPFFCELRMYSFMAGPPCWSQCTTQHP